jgi:hypothetical protein
MYGKYLVIAKSYLAAHLLSGEDNIETVKAVACEKAGRNDCEYLVVEIIGNATPIDIAEATKGAITASKWTADGKEG